MSTSPKVVLVGLMGVGKSTVAKETARRLGSDVADTDRIVEQHAKRGVREIFETDGEETFRDMESRALEAALRSEASVVAAAGGVVLSSHNRELLAQERTAGRVIVVWLRASAETSARRSAGGGHRPLLDGGAQETLERLAAERFALYEQVSDEVIDTDDMNVQAVVDRVLEIANGVSR